MGQRTPAQTIEVFHLLFLRALAVGRLDWFVLKGGANIRYFFGSPRYSNDIDLDFLGREPWQVSESVEKVFEGRALQALTRQAEVDVVEVSAPKQTDKTRRWKIGLRAPGHAELIRTKIEFSGRERTDMDISLEVVPDSVVVPYGVSAPTVRHYGETAAIDQKIAALALRNETKARDVFDLDLLFRRRNSRSESKAPLSSAHASQAAQRARSVTFDSYTTEVAPFLEAEVAALYDAAEWTRLRESVVNWLEAVAESTATSEGPR
jgi:predicted nucleotidyltransferase component of viral defense system